MESLLNFFQEFLISFSSFGNWFFNSTLFGSFKPYQVLLFGGLVVIIGIWIVKLVI